MVSDSSVDDIQGIVKANIQEVVKVGTQALRSYLDKEGVVVASKDFENEFRKVALKSPLLKDFALDGFLNADADDIRSQPVRNQSSRSRGNSSKRASFADEDFGRRAFDDDDFERAQEWTSDGDSSPSRPRKWKNAKERGGVSTSESSDEDKPDLHSILKHLWETRPKAEAAKPEQPRTQWNVVAAEPEPPPVEIKPVDPKKVLSDAKRALKKGASPHQWEGPDTPLRVAISARNVELVTLLLRARANPDESDSKGVSVLHFAAFDDQLDLCRALFQKKADANIRDKHGQTPLFFAPSTNICEVLTQNGAVFSLENRQGQTALHHAGRAGLGDVLMWFVSRVSKTCLDRHDNHGASALYYARKSGVKHTTIRQIRSMTISTHHSELHVHSESMDWKIHHNTGGQGSPSDEDRRSIPNLEEDRRFSLGSSARMEAYRVQSQRAEKQKETRENILAVDVDPVLVRIAEQLAARRIRGKEFFKRWNFLLDNRIAKKDLKMGLKELAPRFQGVCLEEGPKEFKALCHLLDPNGCSDFVGISELDEAIRHAVKKSYMATAKEKSRQKLRDQMEAERLKRLPPERPPSPSSSESDKLSGYNTEEDEAETTLLIESPEAPARRRVKSQGAELVALSRAEASAQAQAKSREWARTRTISSPKRGKTPPPGRPASPVKQSRDEAALKTKIASNELRQQHITERRGQIESMRATSPLMAAALSARKDPVEGSWAMCKTLRVQMNKEEITKQKEKSVLDSEKRIRSMYRKSIAVDIQVMTDEHDKRVRLERRDKLLAKQAKELEEITRKEELRLKSKALAEARWKNVEGTRSDERKERHQLEIEAATKIQTALRGRAGRDTVGQMRVEKQAKDVSATKIQSLFRGKLDRKRAQEMKLEYEEKSASATKIQALFKGRKARAEYQKQNWTRHQRYSMQEALSEMTEEEALMKQEEAEAQRKKEKKAKKEAKKAKEKRDKIEAATKDYLVAELQKEGASSGDAQEATLEAVKKSSELEEYLTTMDVPDKYKAEDAAALMDRLQARARGYLARKMIKPKLARLLQEMRWPPYSEPFLPEARAAEMAAAVLDDEPDLVEVLLEKFNGSNFLTDMLPKLQAIAKSRGLSLKAAAEKAAADAAAAAEKAAREAEKAAKDAAAAAAAAEVAEQAAAEKLAQEERAAVEEKIAAEKAAAEWEARGKAADKLAKQRAKEDEKRAQEKHRRSGTLTAAEEKKRKRRKRQTRQD